jgi:hypothetical protein
MTDDEQVPSLQLMQPQDAAEYRRRAEACPMQTGISQNRMEWLALAEDWRE